MLMITRVNLLLTLRDGYLPYVGQSYLSYVAQVRKERKERSKGKMSRFLRFKG